MNHVTLAVGDYATNPHYIDKVFVNVYSAEELCYVLYENAFLLDKDILNINLVKWIDLELGLHDLAKDLYVLVHQNASASAFVGTILSYVGFYSAEEISKAEEILRMNVSMNVFEKWKAKADFLVENHHFMLALYEYEHIIDCCPDMDATMRGAIFNDMGIVYMNLYLYDSAVTCFEVSYFECDRNEDTLRNLLAAQKMKLSEEEYIKYIAANSESFETSIKLETLMNEITNEFDETDKAKSLKTLFKLKDDGNSNLYYEEINRMTEALKDEYREIVLETERKTTGETAI